MASQAVDQCIENFSEETRPRIKQLVAHMREHYPALEEMVSFQMPTFKLGSGENRNYIAFSGGKNHVSFHTMDFDMIEQLKPQMKKPGKGKGCVQMGLTDEGDLQLVLNAIPEIIARAEK